MAGLCGTWNTTPADNLVNQGWAKWGEVADGSIRDARQSLMDLTDFAEFVPTAVVKTDLTLDVPAHLGAPFARPDAPKRPDLRYTEPTPPQSKEVRGIVGPQQPSIPRWSVARPEFDFSGAPGTLSLDPLEDPPLVQDVTTPQEPGYARPVLPAARDVPVPVLQQFHLPELVVPRPSIGGDVNGPGNGFRYEETDFDVTTLEAIRADMAAVRAGRAALPAAVSDALWGRASEQDHEASVRALRMATRNHAARGWDMPGGLVQAGVLEVIQGVRAADSERARARAIQDALWAREDFWQAVTQGLAAEQALGALHEGQAERMLRAAIFAQEAAVAAHNAMLAGFNAQLALAEHDLAMHREQVQTRLAKLEELRLEIQRAQLVGELNVRDVERYQAEWSGAKLELDTYLAKWKGVEAQLQADARRFERYGLRLQNRAQQLSNHKLEWDGYLGKLQAQETKGRVYQVEGSVFAEQMRGASLYADTERARVGAETDLARLDIETARLELDRFRAQWAGIGERVRAAATIYAGEASLFQGELSAEGARVEYDNKQFALALEEARGRAELRAKEAEMNIHQVLRILDIQGQAIEAVYKSQAALATAAMQTVNLSAGTKSSYGESRDCSTTYSQ
jgi:hypothetical protein